MLLWRWGALSLCSVLRDNLPLSLGVPSQAENIYNDEEPDNTPASELEAQGS